MARTTAGCPARVAQYHILSSDTIIYCHWQPPVRYLDRADTFRHRLLEIPHTGTVQLIKWTHRHNLSQIVSDDLWNPILIWMFLTLRSRPTVWSRAALQKFQATTVGSIPFCPKSRVHSIGRCCLYTMYDAQPDNNGILFLTSLIIIIISPQSSASGHVSPIWRLSHRHPSTTIIDNKLL